MFAFIVGFCLLLEWRFDLGLGGDCVGEFFCRWLAL